MSEAYDTDSTLVRAESNRYDIALDTTIAFSIVSFVLGIITLAKVVGLGTSGGALGDFFLRILAVVVGGIGLVAVFSYANVVPVTSQRVRGIGLGLLVSVVVLTVAAYALPVNLATLLGLVLLGEALALVGAGVVSRLDVVDTQPDASAGLLAGGAFGFFGLFIGVTVAGSVIGFTTVAWVLGLVSGVGFAVLTIAPREDLGSTLSTALVVGLFGAVIATAVIDISFSYNLDQIGENVDGGFTGGVVIPLLVVLGSLLSSWAAAKCRAGFGAQGRQYGAFFVINLNAFLMVAIMASVVVFVVSKGYIYAFHGFSIGALTLLVLLAPLLVFTLDWARTPAGTDEWHSGARQLFRITPIAAIGSLAVVLAGLLVTNTTFTHPFEYTVLQNRQEVQMDTALELTPSLEVGAWVLLLSATVLFVYFVRKTDSLQNVGERFERLDRVKQGVSLLVSLTGVLVLVMAVFGPDAFGLPLATLLGQPLTYVGALAAAGLAVLPLGILRDRSDLAASAYDRTSFVALGIYGALAVLAATALLETTTTLWVGAGPFGLVTTVALLGIAASILLALAVFVARRETSDPHRHRILSAQLTLALAGIAGFVAIMAMHVAFTAWNVQLAGITLADGGSLSWPFVMESELSLAPDSGGIFPAVVGTVWLVIGASLFAIPLGVGAAVFLTEYVEQGYFTGLVEVATNALWSTPSVVFGLFGAAFLLPRFGGDTSLLAGQLVLGFMLLPLVLITSREAIKSVPDEYRDASAALGVNRWQTIRSVVLPAAMPGVITGVILGVGRIAGETAPLILVLGSMLNSPESLDVLGGFDLLLEAPFVFNQELLNSTPALPTATWAIIKAGVSGSTSRGWATAFVLLTVVLIFYAIGIASRTYFRRKLDYE